MAIFLSRPPLRTLADLRERVGGVSPERVRFVPLPGTATEADVVEIEAREDRLDGGGVLPGFQLPLRELFAELDRQGDA